MSDKLRYFDCSETFTLIVGQPGQNLSVVRSLLEEIPFFRKAINGDQSKEAKEKVFRLSEDDPKAVADLLYFVSADYVEPVERVAKDDITEEEAETVKAYVRAFTVVDNHLAEITANRILACLWDYNSTYEVDPDLISLLSRARLRESKLYDFLVEELATEMRSAIREHELLRKSIVSAISGYSMIFDHIEKCDAIELLSRLSVPEKDEVFYSNWWLHTHEVSEECSDCASYNRPRCFK